MKGEHRPKTEEIASRKTKKNHKRLDGSIPFLAARSAGRQRKKLSHKDLRKERYINKPR